MPCADFHWQSYLESSAGVFLVWHNEIIVHIAWQSNLPSHCLQHHNRMGVNGILYNSEDPSTIKWMN